MPIRFTGPNGPEELIPAPVVSIQKQYVRDEAGRKLYPENVFTLTGTIVNVGTDQDSPGAQNESNSDSPTMEDVLSEQKRIRNLFSQDGGRLEIETPGGGGPNTIDAYCTIESLNFDQSIWVNKCTYTVVLRAKSLPLEDTDSQFIQSASENWSITENEDGTFILSHRLQAVGTIAYGSSGINDALSIAKQWCRDRSYSISENGNLTPVKVHSIALSGTLADIPSDTTNFWNRSVSENIGIVGNSWELDENFVYNPSGITREEFTGAFSTEQDNPKKGTITINGTVYGYADKASNRNLRFSRAKTYYNSTVEPNIYLRATFYRPGGYSVSPIPSTKQITYEDFTGIVRYSYTFPATSGFFISNAIDENISISDIGSNDIFAQIQVPGRAEGPVVQYMYTKTLPERTITINAVMAQSSGSSLLSMYKSKPNTNDLIDQLKPSAGNYYIKQNSEEWNPIKRQYSRTVSWVMNPKKSNVYGIPSGINNTQE